MLKRSVIAVLVLMQLALPLCGHARMLTVDPAFEPYVERTEYSVKRALNYLLRSQKEDGSFPGGMGETVGVVAVAGMAFLAAGYTPNATTPEGQIINRCADFCIAHQKPNGYMGDDSGKMYSHCAATLLLSEVSGMVEPDRQARVRTALGSATTLILTAQAVKKKNPLNQGGWRYSPNSTDADMSLTGWAIMSLRAGRMNGAPVPDSAIRNAMVYVRNQEAKKGGFTYEHDRGAGMNVTGVALLCLELCGLHGQDITIRSADWLLDHKFSNLEGAGWKEYGTYYIAQAMFQLGGRYWKAYAEWLYPYWLGNQGEDGAWSGSPELCPAYVTSMVVLALTVPYRQLPIYQRDETVDDY